MTDTEPAAPTDPTAPTDSTASPASATKEAIRAELEATRAQYRELLNSLYLYHEALGDLHVRWTGGDAAADDADIASDAAGAEWDQEPPTEEEGPE